VAVLIIAGLFRFGNMCPKFFGKTISQKAVDL